MVKKFIKAIFLFSKMIFFNHSNKVIHVYLYIVHGVSINVGNWRPPKYRLRFPIANKWFRMNANCGLLICVFKSGF